MFMKGSFPTINQAVCFQFTQVTKTKPYRFSWAFWKDLDTTTAELILFLSLLSSVLSLDLSGMLAFFLCSRWQPLLLYRARSIAHSSLSITQVPTHSNLQITLIFTRKVLPFASFLKNKVCKCPASLETNYLF